MSNLLYRISEKATEDLEQIWFYTFSHWSVEQADRYYNQIISEIEFISRNFDLSINKDHIKPGYRMSQVKSHLVFFRKANDNVIEVVRILHQRMDVGNHLNK